jgi:hypothetical protein
MTIKKPGDDDHSHTSKNVPLKWELLDQADKILKKGKFDIMTAEKQDRKYRRKKQEESNRATRITRRKQWDWGKFGPASHGRKLVVEPEEK